jgi:multidrug transporter EmrE-like cation transporter
MSENIRTIPFIVLAVSLGVLGQVLMKYGMNQYRDAPPPGATGKFLKDLRYVFLNAWVLTGFASYAVSTIIWLYVLTRADLSFAYPFISISYIAVILIGPWLFRESIGGWKVLAIVLIILGVLSMTVSERAAETGGHRDAQPVACSIVDGIGANGFMNRSNGTGILGDSYTHGTRNRRLRQPVF